MMTGVVNRATALVMGLLITLMVLAIACGDGATPTPTPQPRATNTPVAAAAPEPTAVPATSPPATAAALTDAPVATLDISVNGDALEFNESRFTVSAGFQVALTFNNVSTALQHNWVLVPDGAKDEVATRGTAHPTTDWIQPGDSAVIANTKLLAPGTTGSITFAAPPAGTYQFVCTFPGHNSTMFGTFEVGGSGY